LAEAESFEVQGFPPSKRVALKTTLRHKKTQKLFDKKTICESEKLKKRMQNSFSSMDKVKKNGKNEC
jgi:hypothetical protein